MAVRLPNESESWPTKSPPTKPPIRKMNTGRKANARARIRKGDTAAMMGPAATKAAVMAAWASATKSTSGPIGFRGRPMA